MSLMLALISETRLVSPSDLYHLTAPLELTAPLGGAAGGLAPPAIVVVDERHKLPRSCQPVVFVDDDSDPQALAVHYWDPLRSGPAARVYVDRASGFTAGNSSVCEAAAHEVVEIIVDPRANLWDAHPRRWGVEVARETADPVQDTYAVDVRGTSWPVANFVTPQWFDPSFNDDDLRARLFAAGKGFDHLRRLNGPGAIGPEGYVILRGRGEDGVLRVWFEVADGTQLATLARTEREQKAKAHPMSRSLLRKTGAPL